MAKSILDGKIILAVDDEPDVLCLLESEIKETCSNCQFDKATTYEEAARMIEANSYDIVVLDIMGVRGFELLELATSRKFRTAMLTAHALSSEALKKSHDMGARAYLPKDKLGEIVPFLEDVLQYDATSSWKRLMIRLENYFDGQFEPEWKKKIGANYWY
jgi:DNA-binding response OmpR family regulator